MEYKKDKRTKNLTLRDIHVGDWVQVWSEQTERYSPPMKIISIHDDGTIYLVTSDEERCTPFEENIKNIDGLPIVSELLKGFGFKVVKKDFPEYESEVFYNSRKIGELFEYSNNIYKMVTLCYNYYYFHEFIGYVSDYFPELLNLEWNGVEK